VEFERLGVGEASLGGVGHVMCGSAVTWARTLAPSLAPSMEVQADAR